MLLKATIILNMAATFTAISATYTILGMGYGWSTALPSIIAVALNVLLAFPLAKKYKEELAKNDSC